MNKNKIHPLVAILGATFPIEEYHPEIGIKIGYELKKLTSQMGGNICTGGVNGVGLDVCKGVIDYCVEHKIHSNFSIIFPDIPFPPPKEYYLELGRINEKLEIIYAGKNMLQRREKISKFADAGIVLNGSNGTLDEVIRFLNKNKPIFSLKTSGGIAKLISEKIPKIIHVSENIEDLINQVKKNLY